MTELQKQILIAKDQSGQKLNKKELLELLLYPNNENSLLIHILKAKYGLVK